MGSGQKIVRVLQVGFLLPTIAGMIILGYIWISHQYDLFARESMDLASRMEAMQKQRVKEEVQNAVEFVDYMTSQTEGRLKTSIKSRTYEAYAIASHIYSQNDDKPKEKLADLIRDALRPIRFNYGRGYYFAFDMGSVSQLLPISPELEGAYMGEMLSSKGRYIIRDMVDLARTHGEGFYEYTYSKPGYPGTDHRKIAYLKYFAPMDWYIGTGEYLDDVEQDIQSEVLKRLEQVRFGEDGYIFASTYNGLSLLGPGKGTNILESEDHWGREIVAEMIDTARSGGGFVTYNLPAGSGGKPVGKISYVQGASGWDWYVGAGMDVPDMEEETKAQTLVLRNVTNANVLSILCVLVLASLAVLLVAYLVGNRIKTSFSVFEGFFAEAAHKGGVIDLNKLHFKDFTNLAASANEMILKKRQAENEARIARVYLQDMINSMPSVIIGTDKDGRVHLWNSKAEQVTGVSSANAMGKLLDKAFHNLTGYMDYITSAMQGKQVRKEEKITMVLNGRVHFWDLTIYPLAGGEVEGAVVRMDDVTDRVRWEEVMIQTEKMVSLGGLAAGMAHEINNPLAVMMQNSEVIIHRTTGDNPASEKAAMECGISMDGIRAFMEIRGIVRMLEALRDAGSRIAGVVNNMLDFAGNRHGGFLSQNIPVLLDKTIDLASSDYNLHQKYDFKSISIVREYDPAMPGVPCDPSRFQQVIFSLLQNAAQALASYGESDGAPSITIRTALHGAMARIEICDNGPGMDEATRKRAFEPFFTTKGVGKGTGLGLSVSYFIITEFHKGRMRVESEPGKGACFVVDLPMDRRPQ
ncbi:MAG: cache domain-containing protein [Desulfatibacillum sp.]|nr:cache domain-containing protein [Desulfatibacillum sp.]